MARNKRLDPGPDGWCEWQQPIMSGYRSSCCDCGLVHEMEFGVLRKTRDKPDGTWEAVALDPEKYRVQLRARRHRRATAQVRRHLKR